jgi:hypothetical protein
MEHLQNLVLRIKLSVPEEQKKVGRRIGKQSIDDCVVLISRLGDPILCYYCGNYGHSQATCEIKKAKANLVCTKCKRKGHESFDCNLARRIGADKQDEDIEEIENGGAAYSTATAKNESLGTQQEVKLNSDVTNKVDITVTQSVDTKKVNSAQISTFHFGSCSAK